jgi:hypothetical protein
VELESNPGPVLAAAVAAEPGANLDAERDVSTSASMQPSMGPLMADAVLQALRGDDGEMITELRTSDGMVNATKMCKSAGLQLKDFTKKAETRKFFAELSKDLGIAPQKDGISAHSLQHDHFLGNENVHTTTHVA